MIPENLIIRPFTDGDVDAAVGIENESFSDPWSRESFGEVEKSSIYRGFCGEINGVVCGYIIYSSLFEDAEILDVAVSDRYRRRGIAKALIEKTVEAVNALEAQRILLEVRRSNEGAKTLYRSLGFCEIGIRKNYYKSPFEDAVIMEKIIK